MSMQSNTGTSCKIEKLGGASLFHVKFFEIKPVAGFAQVIQLELNRLDVIIFNFQKSFKQWPGIGRQFIHHVRVF